MVLTLHRGTREISQHLEQGERRADPASTSRTQHPTPNNRSVPSAFIHACRRRSGRDYERPSGTYCCAESGVTLIAPCSSWLCSVTRRSVQASRRRCTTTSIRIVGSTVCPARRYNRALVQVVCTLSFSSSVPPRHCVSCCSSPSRRTECAILSVQLWVPLHKSTMKMIMLEALKLSMYSIWREGRHSLDGRTKNPNWSSCTP